MTVALEHFAIGRLPGRIDVRSTGRPFASRLGVLVCGLVLLAAGGCAGFRNPFAYAGPPAPQVLRPGASVEEVIAAVNANSARVHTYAANGATITPLGMPGIPSLSGSIMIERPSRFRVNAGTALTGAEIDLGSNDQLLWMWIRQSEPPGVYVCRRDQFAGSRAHQVMPVDPDWLPTALGLVEFDPQAPHQLRMLPDNNLELVSTMPGPAGTRTRVCVIDPTRAWVLKQHVYDATGAPIATALASQHRYFPEHQVSLPSRVEVRVPPARLSLAIDVGQVYLNTALGDPGQLWVPPQIDGYPQIDIGGGAACPVIQPARDSSQPAVTAPRAARQQGGAHVSRPDQVWEPVHRLPKPSPL